MILLEDSVFNGIYKSSLKFYSLYSLLLSLFYVSQRHCYSIADVYFFFLNIFLHLCSSITHRGVDIKREKGKVLENVALAVKSSQVSEEKKREKIREAEGEEWICRIRASVVPLFSRPAHPVYRVHGHVNERGRPRYKRNRIFGPESKSPSSPPDIHS